MVEFIDHTNGSLGDFNKTFVVSGPGGELLFTSDYKLEAAEAAERLDRPVEIYWCRAIAP